MDKYGTTNLRPGSLRDESEREYIFGKIGAEEKQDDSAPKIIRYWKKEKFTKTFK